MKTLILAGGFATRLWPITEKRAKPLMYLHGKPIISHLVEKIPPEMEIIVSTNQIFQDDFSSWRNEFPHRKIKIFIEDSATDDFKKGALGATALVIIQEKIAEDLMLLAGDNYFGFQMEDFIRQFKAQPLLAVYDIKDLNEAKKYGVISTDQKKVIRFEEKPLQPQSTLVSTGCYIIPQHNLIDIVHYAKQKNDDLGGIFEYLLRQNEEIHYYPFTTAWYDIGSFSSYLTAHRHLQGNQQLIEKNVRIDPKSTLTGAIYLGDHSIIENSLIENSIIMPHCQIRDCVIRNCIIDKNAKLIQVDLNQKMIREGINLKN